LVNFLRVLRISNADGFDLNSGVLPDILQHSLKSRVAAQQTSIVSPMVDVVVAVRNQEELK
jgi:hypothetical protein